MPFFLLLQAFPHIFWHRSLFRRRQIIFISKQKIYLQYHSKGVKGMTLPLPALCNASVISRVRRYQDYSWAHLLCPYYRASRTHPYNQATACSQVTRAQIRAQVISLGFTVSARPWCLSLCRLSKVKVPATSAALTGGKSVSCSTRHSGGQPGQHLLQCSN